MTPTNSKALAHFRDTWEMWGAIYGATPLPPQLVNDINEQLLSGEPCTLETVKAPYAEHFKTASIGCMD